MAIRFSMIVLLACFTAGWPFLSHSLAQTSTAAAQDVKILEGFDDQTNEAESELVTLQNKLSEQNERLAKLEQTQKRLLNEIARLSADKAEKYTFGPIVKLFDGKTLDGWEVSSYGGEGECTVADGQIHMAEGDPISGINVVDGTELPTSNYEVSFYAMKIEGNDFFGSLTFPVNDSFCTLVVGGWGGPVIGLSNIDDQDASENESRTLKKFEKNQWYHVRVRVLADRITAWFDGEPLVNQSIAGRNVTIRNDVIPSRPLGISSFCTRCAIKDIELKTLELKTLELATEK